MFDKVHVEFGESTALEVIDRLTAVAGLDVVDVGCGTGELARALAARGARVVGIEPDDEQARRNGEAQAVPGLVFHRAVAEALPGEPASADGVFFSKSLHHVPVDAMDRAIGEAVRVLRDDGFLFVLEPDIDGAYSDLMRPFHDETAVRLAALATLERSAMPVFAEMRRAAFTVTRSHRNFGEFAQAVLGQSFNCHRRADVEADDVRVRFEAGWDGAAYSFAQPMSVFVFSGKIANA
jgi:ubiquinone/menaquinone biosynthesis C-methylase UbiE